MPFVTLREETEWREVAMRGGRNEAFWLVN